jgi:hypothetical protein
LGEGSEYPNPNPIFAHTHQILNYPYPKQAGIPIDMGKPIITHS